MQPNRISVHRPSLLFSLALTLSLGLVLTVPMAQATTVLAVDVAESVDRAELILVGEVLDVRSAPTGDASLAFTFVTFAVDEELKGSSRNATLTLRFEGGQLPNGDVIEVVGMPTFAVGDSHLLFVDGNGDFACPLVGWWQGRLTFTIHPETGEEVLMDGRGAPVSGIADHRWQHAPERLEADGSVSRSTGLTTEVVWQEGVEILPEEPAARGAQAATAATVLAALRQLIIERSALDSFRPGEVVFSARIDDVPASGLLTAEATTRGAAQ